MRELRGVAVISTAGLGVDGMEVLEVWTAGDDTQRARTVKIGEILYLGFENTGIARYDLANEEWLTTWDGTQGYIDDDDVTTLIPGKQSGTMWAGGDFGLTLIDVENDTVLINWGRGLMRMAQLYHQEALRIWSLWAMSYITPRKDRINGGTQMMRFTE